MFDTILVPLDGSPWAEAALAVAELIPSRNVCLLNVRMDTAQLDEVCEAAERGELYLEQVAAPLRAQGRHVRTEVVFGDAGRRIVDFAESADLVVMGSRGCGATRTFLLGSVANWVARHSPAPTLIVRGGDDPATAFPLTRIVVPLDGTAPAEAALPLAATLAGDLGLPVHLVRVQDFDLVRASVEAGMAAARASARTQAEIARLSTNYLERQAQELRNRNVAVTSELRTGDPASELLASINAGDLVVLATSERSGLDRWLLGSVADELVRKSPGPVLLVRSSVAGARTPAG